MTKKAVRSRLRKLPSIPKGRRLDVSREEFDRVIDLLNVRGDILNSILRDQEIQLRRIAQIQAELDLIKRQWERVMKDAS